MCPGDDGGDADSDSDGGGSDVGGEGPSGGEGYGGGGFGGDETSDEGFGFTGQQGYDVSSTDDAGLGVGWGAPPSVAETAATEDIGVTPTPTAEVEATKGTINLQTVLAKEKAVALSAKQQEQKGFFEEQFEDISIYDLIGVPDPSKFSISPERTGGHYSTSFGLTPPSPSKGAGISPTDESIEASLASIGVNVTSPDPGLDGADFQKQRSAARVNRAASNNTTLAVSEEDDFTRQELRRARRQITRFA
jgi:hypothetical protein